MTNYLCNVSSAFPENYNIGINSFTWGVETKYKKKIQNVKSGDFIVFVLKSHVKSIHKIESSFFYDDSELWPAKDGDLFAYRIKISMPLYKGDVSLEKIYESISFMKGKRFSGTIQGPNGVFNNRLTSDDLEILKKNMIKQEDNFEIKEDIDKKLTDLEKTFNNEESIPKYTNTSYKKEEINQVTTEENIENLNVEDEIRFDSKEEEFESDDYLVNNLQVHTEQKDFTVLVLYQKYKEGKLILQPDFQRQFVWDRKKASRLIESALMRIPLPTFYLAQRNDNKLYVIDGQQRLRSFFSFIDGIFPEEGIFKLTGLQFYKTLNGKNFQTIPDADQDKIKDCPLRSITFLPDSKEDIRFEVFERLNTGAVSLNDQELRNCIYRGSYNELLKELSRYPDYMFLLGIKKPDKRMNDIALVLRFTAFFNSGYLKYKSPMRSFFNNDMIENQNINEIKKEKIASAFKNSVSIIKSLFGEYAFRRFYIGDDFNKNGVWRRGAVNKSLYDVLMNSFADKDKNMIYSKLDCIREAFIDLMTSDKNFVECIELATSDVKKVHTRFDLWRIRLNQILEITNKQPRCFSYDLKKSIYEQNSICQICGQHISCLDDATLDHVEQYWKGGQTIPENARLTHRYCNLTRSRLT